MATEIAGRILSILPKAAWQAKGWPIFAKWNQRCCQPPLNEKELVSVWKSIQKLESSKPDAEEEVMGDTTIKLVEHTGNGKDRRLVYAACGFTWEFDSKHLIVRDGQGKQVYKRVCPIAALQNRRLKNELAGELVDLKLFKTQKKVKEVLALLGLELAEELAKQTEAEEKVELLNSEITLDAVWQAVTKIGVTSKSIVEIIMASCISVAFKFPVPIWLILIGNPSSLKTELIKLPRGLEKRIVYLSTMSENAFASGYIPADGSDPNDLLDMLDNKVLLIRDLTTLFSLNEETVKKILGDLTSIFDGEFEKFTATRGLIKYKAQFPFIACITPAILAKHHNYVNQLGSRFLFYRIARLTDEQRQQGFEIAWSKESRSDNIQQATVAVSSYCTQVVKNIENGLLPKIEDPAVQQWLNNAADFVARARGLAITQAEEFKNDKGEDVSYYSPVEIQIEEPWRAINQLRNLAIALAALRGKALVTMHECETLKEVVRSTAPPNRALVLDALINRAGMKAKEIGELMEKSTKTAQRELKELEMLGLVHKYHDPNFENAVNVPWFYSLEPTFVSLLTPEPENNSSNRSLCPTGNYKSSSRFRLKFRVL